MSTVETVLGSRDTGSLGATLMHEHLFSLYPELQVQDPEWDEELRVADAVVKLREARAAGIQTIVDLTVYGLGRNVPRVARVARESGVNVIVATGLYFFTELPRYFRFRTERQSGTFIEDLFVREITDGIFETGIKASVIKCVTDEAGVNPDVDFALRAAARAQLRTGVPISTHAHAASRRGREQQAIFREEGVDLRRVVIGHAGDSDDLSYLEELVSGGSYIGMDRFGSQSVSSLDKRIDIVAEMCRRGYASRMVLSHDTNCYSDNLPRHLRGKSAKFTPPPFTYISQCVIPRLRQSGISDELIHQMLVVNPQDVFGS